MFELLFLLRRHQSNYRQKWTTISLDYKVPQKKNNILLYDKRILEPLKSILFVICYIFFRYSFWLHALQQHKLVARQHIQSALWVAIMRMWVVQTNTPSKYVNMQIYEAFFLCDFHSFRSLKKTEWNFFFSSSQNHLPNWIFFF